MMGNVIVNEMETDAVFWWATIFCRTQCWILISKGIIKYVSQLLEENKKLSHSEEVALGARKPVAMIRSHFGSSYGTFCFEL